jgi:hypothetical protein
VNNAAKVTAWSRRLIAAVGAVLMAGFVLAPPGRADDGPVSCEMGAYLSSLSRIDTAAGTFDASFWMWSLCPDGETQPLKTMEFTNGVKIDAGLDATAQRGKQYWSTRKISGTFRQDFSLANYPFDDQTLKIQIEEGELDTREVVYTADTANSRTEPDLPLKTWTIASFRVTAGEITHPTTYGDPSLAGGSSTYAQFTLEIQLHRQSHMGDFLKSTFVVYIAAVLALVSLLIIDGRVGLLGATMFTVVLSFVNLDRLLGPHDGPYLLDKVHFATLGLIMAAGAWGVRSTRAISLGADKTKIHRQDVRAALVLLVVFVVVNIVLVATAIHNASGQ